MAEAVTIEHEPTRGAPTAQAHAAAGNGTLWAFTLATFLSALLLFSIQPMFAKMVLPVLGGSPSVWAVAMCFFQAALLAGYCYAHVLITKLPLKMSGLIHLCLCLLAFVALPIRLPALMGEPPAGEPYLWQLGLFAVAVGLPFMAVAANAPLFQAWFARTGHAQGRDPYFLYAASNLGSLIALLGYPFLLEPIYGVRALSVMWAVGYAALVAAIAFVFMLVRKRLDAAPAVRGTASDMTQRVDAFIADPDPTLADRLKWVGLAMIPSALLTAFTTHVTTDVASAPLLWVLPLALYLLTFVLVFREKVIVLAPLAAIVWALAFALLWQRGVLFGMEFSWIGAALLAAILAAAFAMIFDLMRGFGVDGMRWLLGLHLAAVVAALLVLAQTRNEGWFVTAPLGMLVFFASAMVAHRTLYEARPAASHLTGFYLYMSLGGALGGLVTALAAPKLFSEVFEYPLLLALTMACRPSALDWFKRKEGQSRFDAIVPLWLIAAAGILAYYWVPWLLREYPSWSSMWTDPGSITSGAALWFTWPYLQLKRLISWSFSHGAAAMMAGLMGLLLLLAWRHPQRQLIAALGMVGAVTLLPSSVRKGEAQRSYFGVYRVMLSADGQWNTLVHGTTLHGAQRVRDETGNPVADITPATYYHPASPMAKSVDMAREIATEQNRKGRFGVIGLGTGSLACQASEGEDWRFFEIDPVMIDIAVKSESFTFVENCQPRAEIVIGDARLTMAKQPSASYDLIIVDAFSSDAVPVHLMTAEALAMYVDKLTPTGAVLLHISNRYLDLDGVLGATAPLVPGLYGTIVSDDTSDGSYAQSTSTVALFSRNADALDRFKTIGPASDLDSGGLRGWTDDYSDILGPFTSKYRKRFGK
jgi:hypothetical protein